MIGKIFVGYNTYGHRITVRVIGYPEMDFYGYTPRDAVKMYREKYGLSRKHIRFYNEKQLGL